LAQVLRPLRDHPAFSSPHLLVGVETRDDAGAYRLPDGRVLIQTVDFFTPVVDDPADWGRIAAANALSDVYAMGGEPLTALQLVCWPSGDLPLETLSAVIQGGSEVMARAGCTVVGGHTVDDPEPKYGFAVTGTAVRLTTNAGARPGDLLVLTKPIGTGVISTALKHDAAPPEALDAAVASMRTLNRAAADAASRFGAHAMTDVTGYGLLGHLREMMQASGCSATVFADQVPVFPGVRDLIAADEVPGGTERNLDALDGQVEWAAELPIAERLLLADAQTSGGLLIAIPPEDEHALREALAGAGVTTAATVGRVVARREAPLEVSLSRLEPDIATR